MSHSQPRDASDDGRRISTKTSHRSQCASRPDGGEKRSGEGVGLGSGASGGVVERAQGPPGGAQSQAGADLAERRKLDGERSGG